MKTISCLLLVTAFGHWLCLGQRFTERQTLLRVDLDHDGNYDWEAAIYAYRFNAGTPDEYYDVGSVFQVGPVDTSLPLRASASRIDFDSGQLITKATAIHPDSNVLLLAYGWVPFDGSIGDYAGVCRYQTSAFIGAKFTDPDTGDVLVGWFKYSRPSLEPGTAFTLESWAYNPIPNEPIKAGEPPDLPEPSFALSEEGVTVSWPAKASMLRLETATSLTSPVQWQPIETGGATSVTLPQPAAGGAFFRLVAPEP